MEGTSSKDEMQKGEGIVKLPRIERVIIKLASHFIGDSIVSINCRQFAIGNRIVNSLESQGSVSKLNQH